MLHYDHRYHRIPVKPRQSTIYHDAHSQHGQHHNNHAAHHDAELTMGQVAIWIGVPSLLLYFLALLIAL
ncbi:MAG TPA: hypothetical protein VK158_00405 [Acidobacteriota bacterium]|nr:hypothetical protein [Acidobacteriota bacterium]